MTLSRIPRVGEVAVLSPDTDILWLEPPKVPEDLNALIALVVRMIEEAGLPPVLQGG